MIPNLLFHKISQTCNNHQLTIRYRRLRPRQWMPISTTWGYDHHQLQTSTRQTCNLNRLPTITGQGVPHQLSTTIVTRWSHDHHLSTTTITRWGHPRHLSTTTIIRWGHPHQLSTTTRLRDHHWLLISTRWAGNHQWMPATTRWGCHNHQLATPARYTWTSWIRRH